LMGISNTAGSLSGFLSPAVVGIITTEGVSKRHLNSRAYVDLARF
jgi:hypothetical protein